MAIDPSIATAIGTPEVVGIGALAMGFGILFWRIFQLTAKMNSKLVEVVEKNATSHQNLSNAIDGLDESVKKNTEVTSKTAESLDRQRDSISNLLVEMVRTPKRRN